MAQITYTPRSIRQHGAKDNWEVTLSHTNPMTGETVRTYHNVTAKTRKQALKKGDELILELERKGGAISSGITVFEFVDAFLEYKEESGTIEPSTVRSYCGESKWITSYIGGEKLSNVTIATVNSWRARMTKDGYAPKTCAKVFRLFKQALKWAVAQDLITKNPCDFCKPPMRVKTPINALSREDRTRMMRLAVAAQPAPLGMAIELALTTGMRRGEVCALRWSDLNDGGTISVTHALGNGEGGFYLKEPKTESSRRTIPLTRHTFQTLKAMQRESRAKMAEFGLKGDPFILGTQEPDSRPYNPTQLGKDFGAFCKILQDERLQVHVPRSASHVRDDDDRGRHRRAHRGILPRPRLGEHDARHLRRRGPRGQEGRGLQGGQGLRRGHDVLPLRRGVRGGAAGARAHALRGAARGHARPGEGRSGRREGGVAGTGHLGTYLET